MIIDKHLEAMPPGYLARFGADLVSQHLRLLTPPPHAMELRTAVIPGAPISTIVVATVDRPALLAAVAGALALRNLNVLEARAVTRADGLVVDTFRVEDALGSDMVGAGRWPAVREELNSAISGKVDLADRLEAKRRAYPAKHPTAPPVVKVEGKYIDVRATDRVGLLYDLASAMSELGLEVQLAKIDTRAGEAIDVFEIENPHGHPAEVIRARLCEPWVGSAVQRRYQPRVRCRRSTKVIWAGLRRRRASSTSHQRTRSISGNVWLRPCQNIVKWPGSRDSGLKSASTPQPKTVLPDRSRTEPSSIQSSTGHTQPVSSANSRAAAALTSSPGSTSPLMRLQDLASLRAKKGPPG